MRRGGPYLSARVDKVRGNNTEAAHCSSSHTLRPRPRAGSTEGGGVARHSGETGGRGRRPKMWIEGSNRRDCRYSAVSIHPTKTCLLLFRKKGVGSLVWIDLLRLELRHVSALFCAASGVIWQRNHVFRPPANIFALQLRPLSVSPSPGTRRAARSLFKHFSC